MGETQPDLKQPPEDKDAQEVPPEILEEHIRSSIREDIITPELELPRATSVCPGRSVPLWASPLWNTAAITPPSATPSTRTT